ncbi:MAG: bifunctional DNA primase/polymerase [Pyrobaculum sp.]|jgi:hypothetical protein
MTKLPHEELIERGYNAVPVDAKKQPLAPRYKECYDRHCPELTRLFEERGVKQRQTGLALLGRINPHYPSKILIIIDIDDPRRFPEEARRLLEGTWRWLTGPRCPHDYDKHSIVCDSGACRHRDHQFRLEEAPRGEAYAVLVPAEVEKELGAGVAKLMGGAVEVRARGYQLLPPSLHPSGAMYEWILSPWAGGEFRHPKELVAEEFRQLLGLLGHKPGSGGVEVQQDAKCRRYRELGKDVVKSVVELVKPYYVPGFRNHLLYALLGILRRNCVASDSIVEVYETLQAWATSVYTDVDRKHDDYILQGVLSRDWRLYGRPKFVETVVEVLKSRGVGEVEAKAEALSVANKLLELIGARRRVLILVSRGGKLAGANSELYYANHPSVGIARMVKRVRCQKPGKAEGAEGECEVKWGYDVVAKHVYIDRAVMHVDPIANVVFFTVQLRDLKAGRVVALRYVTMTDVVETIANMGAVGVNVEEMRRIVQSIIVETAKKIRRPPVAGIIADSEGAPALVAYGPYGRRFRQVLSAQGDPSAFVELLGRFYAFDPKVLRAYAVALYSAFNTYRKLRGLRNKWLILRGEAGTGKTQLAKTVANYIFNLPDEGDTDAPPAVHSAGALFSPARLSRDLGFTTLPKLFDEGKTLTISAPAITDIIKRAMNGLIAYETAERGSLFTRQYPAYASAIVTTQAMEVKEPGLRNKLVVIDFDKSDRRSDHETFLRWREEHKADLMAFGRFYLETVVRERPDLLAVDEDKYVWAAEEALRHVLAKLGVAEVRFPADGVADTEDSSDDEVESFVRWLVSKSRELLLRLPAERRPANPTAAEVVQAILISVGGIEDKVDCDGETVKIYSGVIKEINGTTLSNLAQKINDALKQNGYGEDAATYQHWKRGYRIVMPLTALHHLVDAYT